MLPAVRDYHGRTLLGVRSIEPVVRNFRSGAMLVFSSSCWEISSGPVSLRAEIVYILIGVLGFFNQLSPEHIIFNFKKKLYKAKFRSLSYKVMK